MADESTEGKVEAEQQQPAPEQAAADAEAAQADAEPAPAAAEPEAPAAEPAADGKSDAAAEPAPAAAEPEAPAADASNSDRVTEPAAEAAESGAAATPEPAAEAAVPEPCATPPAVQADAQNAAAAQALAAIEAVAAADAHASVDLAAEPEYPPPDSVPRPRPPANLKVFPPPTVDEVTPAQGPVFGETKLTLVGKNLFRASIVRIGGLIAQTVGADEPRELRVLTPPIEKPGEVDVTIENPHVPPTLLPKAFRYEPLAAPHIVSVAPDHVATKGRTELTVMGENFVKGTVVLFDGTPVDGARFVNATTIDVTAPPGDHGKLVSVSVRNPDGATAVAPRAFMYDERFG